MKFIRIFLWGLVATMTLQGFLKADEYGISTSMMGGISMMMSIWGERAKGLVGLGPHYVPLPHALVAAALQETAHHPGIQAAPQLKHALHQEQHIWRGFRDKQISWMLQHSALVGAIQSDPSGRTVWSYWHDLLNVTETLLRQQQAARCVVNANRPHCIANSAAITVYEHQIHRIHRVIHVWNDVLQMQPVRTAIWWRVTQNTSALDASFDHYTASMARLHNVTWANDPRIASLLQDIRRFTTSGVTNNTWLERIMTSLMEGEVWAACLEHVRQRESRVREMMMATGVQDLYNAHERILNASLRVVAAGAEHRLVLDWFAEMGAKAWWMGDDIPAVVRRCVATENGECRRIGPTEISAMTAHMGAAGAVLEDWSRRLYIGMWNGLPALGLLFLVEFAVLCLHVRGSGSVGGSGDSPIKAIGDEPRIMVLRLENEPRRARRRRSSRSNSLLLQDNQTA
jgi:hypothetical protein